jgi:hypothetical protein
MKLRNYLLTGAVVVCLLIGAALIERPNAVFGASAMGTETQLLSLSEYGAFLHTHSYAFCMNGCSIDHLLRLPSN